MLSLTEVSTGIKPKNIRLQQRKKQLGHHAHIQNFRKRYISYEWFTPPYIYKKDSIHLNQATPCDDARTGRSSHVPCHKVNEEKKVLRIYSVRVD